MASGALFGSSATNRGGSKHLVEFRAGKMRLNGTTVTPDKRKGLLYVHQSDDSLVHFCWKDRTTGKVEDDLIIFPDDCEFKRVSQCTTGRVYILKFKSSSRKLFFWLQEGKTDKDEENCKKLNEFLNNPPPPGSSGGNRSSGLPSELAAMGGEGGLGGMLGNMDQQQLMQLLGGRGLSALGGLGALIGEGRPNSAQSSTSSTPSRTQSALGQTRASGGTTTAASSSVGAGTSGNDKPASQRPSTAAAALPTQTPKQPIQLSDLQSILGSMNLPAGQSNQSEQRQSLSIDLSQAISADVMAPILTNSEIQKQLMEHLPVGESLPRDPEQLSSTLQSPQFQQAMSLFGMALQSGQLGPLMGQFGLNAQAIDAANKGDLEGFARAMQTVKPADKKDKESSDKGKNEKDDDESMSVD